MIPIHFKIKVTKFFINNSNLYAMRITLVFVAMASAFIRRVGAALRGPSSLWRTLCRLLKDDTVSSKYLVSFDDFGRMRRQRYRQFFLPWLFYRGRKNLNFLSFYFFPILFFNLTNKIQ
jgi:hypothetical protein